MSSVVSICVIVWMAYMIVKKHYPQGILLLAGIILLSWAVFVNGATILPAKESSGSGFFDIFSTIEVLMSKGVAGLGLMIMAIAGFAKYMDYIGAGKALFAVVAAPIKKIKSPYILLVACFYISQILVIFIPSHAGLALLLMVTMYPILIKAGVSKLSALGVIGCAQYIDVGPGSANTILAANIAGLDPAIYFVKWQLPIFITTTLVLGIVHFFVQRWWDRKEGYVHNVVNYNLKEDVDKPPPYITIGFSLKFSVFLSISKKVKVLHAA